MNNIIRSQLFIMKKKSTLMILVWILSLSLGFFAFSLTQPEERIETLPMIALIIAMLFATILASVLMTGYSERIQLYEIMAGKKPNQIIFGRTAAFIPAAMAFYAAFFVLCLCFDSSAGMLQRLLLFGVIFIRLALCVVFLSPLTKESALAPTMTIMLLLPYMSNDLKTVAHSPISFLSWGQCIALGTEITADFSMKIIVSAVVACVIYYLIGYYTLKKKIDLEPHKIL